MSQTSSLKQQEGGNEATRTVLSGPLAMHVLIALSDKISGPMLESAISEGKTVQQISLEQAIPLSSCYRRARELVDQGLLVVERVVVTREGKKYATYRSSFKSIEMGSDFKGISVSAELNADIAEKFRQKWFCISYPDGR